MSQQFQLQEKREVFDEYNLPTVTYLDIDVVTLKLVVAALRDSDQQLTSPLPSYQAHTSSKEINRGTFLFNGVQRFRVEYVDNAPRLSVLYLKEI